ncbi:MAG: B12-binding domain-containing radical SAM protein [Deltaproteobacteria bacterium HGW-Deltaproteobacteria-4]|nr:MAG: B12-binding domain-containing radical SAM protein [Deltaproteobacteria bacterium HGW-Deltaproteobacteria-4]
MHLHLVTLHVKRSPQSVPLAAAFLQASIAAHFQPSSPIRVSTADCICGTAVETVLERIVEAKADIVGFSLYVWNRAEVSLYTQQLRVLFPRMILLGGGAEATADPAGIMAEAPFDFLIAGEGEGTLPELLHRLQHGLALDDLPGLFRRQDGRVVHTPPPPPLSLDHLPSPWLAGQLDAYIPDGVLWQLARGCSFACEFCFDGMGTRTVRRFPLEQVAAELDYLVRHGVRQVFVLDSTFNQDLKRAKLILQMIRKQALGVHFHFEIRYEFLDPELAQLFASISCSLQIGLQSASPQILGMVGRSFDPKEFSRKIALLNHAGVTFGFDLIYGLPGDSLPEFCKSLDFALGQYPNQLDIFPLAILPGTPLAGKSGELQLQYLPHPPYTILATPTFSARDLGGARRLAQACDIFYSRGKAVAWFNSIAAGLKLSPSVLLLAFADWVLAEIGHDPKPEEQADETIWSWQRRFLSEIFPRQNVAKLLPMALDLVDYNYYHAAIVQSPPPRSPKARELAKIDALRTPLRRSDSARFATFHYDIEELLQLGAPQLTAAVPMLKAVGSFAVLYSGDGAVCTEVLPQMYFQLLMELNGNRPAEKLAATLGISSNEARKFLKIALQEGIVAAAPGREIPALKKN